MECKHCAYENDREEFYKLEGKARRETDWDSPKVADVYGCPKCGKMFIVGFWV